MFERTCTLLLVLFGAGICTSFSETKNFNVSLIQDAKFKIPLPHAYSLIGGGSDPSMCINVTTDTPIDVSLNACGVPFMIGTFSSGYIQLNQSTIEKVMKLGTNEECKKDLVVVFRSYMESSLGKMNFFKCECVAIIHPTFVPRQFYPVENRTCHPTVTTWEDRSQEIRFYLRDEAIARRAFHLEQAIQAAIGSVSKTICFHFKGNGFIKLAMFKCHESRNITLLLNSDTTFGFSNQEKKLLAELSSEKCADKKDGFTIDVQTTTVESITGLVSIYMCNRDLSEDNIDLQNKLFDRLSPDTGYMQSRRSYFFNLKSFSIGSYAADLLYMVDNVLDDKTGTTSIEIEIESFAPVSVSVSRCKNSEEKMMLANIAKGKVELTMADVMKIKRLSMMSSCGTFEDSESMYVHVQARKLGASGSVKFSLVPGAGYRGSLSLVSFNMAENSTLMRAVNIENMVDEALMNRSTIGYSLNASSTINIFLSKCKGSKRQLIGAPSKNGTFVWSRYVLEGISKVMKEKCGDNEDMEPTVGYVHIEAFYGPTRGVLMFMRAKPDGTNKKSKIINYKPFAKLESDYIASSSHGVLILESRYLNSSNPPQIDINYFTRTVLDNSHLNMLIETSSDKEVTLVFSRCQNDTTNQLTIKAKDETILTLDQVKELHRLMRTVPCEENARFGLFVRAPKGTLDTVFIQTVNFREDMKQFDGDYVTAKKRPTIVGIPLGNYNRSVSIHITNSEKKPVLITISMCTPLHKPSILWYKNMTVANFKFDTARIQELSNSAGKCEADKFDDKMTLFLTIQSENSRGTIVVDKIDEEFCNTRACLDGSARFYESTEGWIIAQ